MRITFIVAVSALWSCAPSTTILEARVAGLEHHVAELKTALATQHQHAEPAGVINDKS